MRIPLLLFLAVLAASIAHSLHYYPQLPERMASHFNASGQPDGWSTPAAFLCFDIGMNAFMAAVFVLLPLFMARIPTRWWSLPNRDYWLAPERLDQTIRLVRVQMLWFGAATLALLAVVKHLAIQANLMEEPHLSTRTMVYVMGLYFGFVAVWSVRFIMMFYRKPPA